jgi:hypothetical protein
MAKGWRRSYDRSNERAQRTRDLTIAQSAAATTRRKLKFTQKSSAFSACRVNDMADTVRCRARW